jgi:hypothetical protein
VRSVIVDGQSGVAVRIVSTGMAPVHCAAAHDDGEYGGECSIEQTSTPCVPRHPQRTVAVICWSVNRGRLTNIDDTALACPSASSICSIQ